MVKDISMRESFASRSEEQASDVYEPEEEEPSSRSATVSQSQQNLNVTILASKFAASTRKKGAQKMKVIDMPKLQKPEEPDFSADQFD